MHNFTGTAMKSSLLCHGSGQIDPWLEGTDCKQHTQPQPSRQAFRTSQQTASGTPTICHSPLFEAAPHLERDGLGVAAPLDVEHALVAPAVLVVSDQRPLGVGGQGGLPGSWSEQRAGASSIRRRNLRPVVD